MQQSGNFGDAGPKLQSRAPLFGLLLTQNALAGSAKLLTADLAYNSVSMVPFLQLWSPFHEWHFDRLPNLMAIVIALALKDWSDHNEILHISRQLSCLGMCKISLWSDWYERRCKLTYFSLVWKITQISLVRQTAGPPHYWPTNLLSWHLRNWFSYIHRPNLASMFSLSLVYLGFWQ